MCTARAARAGLARARHREHKRAGTANLRASGHDVAYELALAGGALAAAEAARWILRVINAAGGFTVRPLSTQFAPLSEIFRHNLPVAGQCLLALFGADVSGPPAAQATAFLLLHLAGVALAAAGVARGGVADPPGAGPGRPRAARRHRGQRGRVPRDRSGSLDVSSAREIAPVLPFAAALAARELSPVLARLPRRPNLPVAGAAPPAARTAPPAPGTSPSALGRASAVAARLAGPLLVVIGIGYVGGLGA